MKKEVRGEDSWESSNRWYDKIVGPKGHYYHQRVVLPGVMKLLNLSATSENKLLDLACGQGVLSRHLPRGTGYLGVDASPSLIQAAERQKQEASHHFKVADLKLPLSIKERDFSHATIILALQNIAEPQMVLKNAASLLKKGGRFILVLSHPCFRIPRQSSWQIDQQKKIQFRRIDRYYSPLEIPIQTNPSHGDESASTWTYHHPLSSYSLWLKEAGFVIEQMEEWLSDKKSVGPTATMENRSRQEFPLFLALACIRT
ncbi:MAG: class I SAM-dependent methyltransferase [Chlamydiales bacterium]|nr:class I SAM-dependent methyltransferase [Chlamydiales bacterium]